MRFIAIDSSMANTGIALGIIIDGRIIVGEIDLVETEKSKSKTVRASSDTIDRCRKTYGFIQDAIEEFKPSVIFAETPSGSQSSSAMKSYGITCQLIAALSPTPIEVTPIEVKKAVAGKKTVSKRDMIDWASNLYPELQWKWNGKRLQNKNEHMADAIAIAYAGVKTPEFLRLKRALENE